jgi:dTDP-4-amino-4,6-dideoxygalactose transaminase
MIPISQVKFGHEEQQLVLSTLRSGMVAQGPLVKEFEDRFAQKTGVKHAIAVNNGTTSLVACIQALNLIPGDEVITSPFTFIATLNAILEAGAVAVFADIKETDFNLDPESVESRITSRTRAIMPVHLYGQMADMHSISKIANKHALRIIEDSAQSHFASQNGRNAGSFDLGSFSFYATKNLTTGEGGLITTNDDEAAERLRIMRNQGMKQRYQYVMAGHNYRMTDLQAALVIPQLSRYEETVRARTDNAAFYSQELAGIEGLITPEVVSGRTHVWHQYTLRVTKDSGLNRESLSEKLTNAGVGSGFYYPKLVFEYEPYQYRNDVVFSSLPVAQKVVTEVISIPVHPYVTVQDREHVVDAIKKAFGESS